MCSKKEERRERRKEKMRINWEKMKEKKKEDEKRNEKKKEKQMGNKIRKGKKTWGEGKKKISSSHFRFVLERERLPSL